MKFTPPRLTNNKNSHKNTAVECLRFYFTCIICLWHCRGVAPFVEHGYIAVDFFFILSGYFIYQSLMRHPDVGVLDFTLRKMKRFAVPLVVSLVLLMLLDRKQYFYLSEPTPDGIIESWFVHLHEFFFCQTLGLTTRLSINGPLWYISILLFGGALLYALLRCYEKKALSLFLPAICLFGFAYLYNDKQAYIPGLNRSMMCGISEMALGILLAVAYKRKKIQIERHASLFGILGLIALLLFSLMVLAKGNNDYLALFLAPMMIVAAMIKSSISERLFGSRIWEYLGDISVYMYFIHLFVASLYYILASRHPIVSDVPVWLSTSIYLIIVCVCAQGLKFLTQRIMKS